jgi:cytochrome c-type biogenesis protein CcmE
MDPVRKRKIRLVVALSAAVLLAAVLVYTSFNASNEAKEPSQLLTAQSGQTYDLTGVVVPGSVRHSGSRLDFRVEDRAGDGRASIPVRYSGEIPDPFRGGREIIVTGRLENRMLVGQRDSLITKCPSKFTTQAQQDPQHVVITTGGS